jgi:hypothetical protein
MKAKKKTHKRKEVSFFLGNKEKENRNKTSKEKSYLLSTNHLSGN